MKTPLNDKMEQDDVPPCFGKEWDEKEPDCKVRCTLFSPCGLQMTRAKVEALTRSGGEVAPRTGIVGPQVTPNLGETSEVVPPPMMLPVEPFLSVPELPEPDDTPWHVLGRSLLRGIGKSVGLTLANFFDSVPLARLFRKK